MAQYRIIHFSLFARSKSASVKVKMPLYFVCLFSEFCHSTNTKLYLFFLFEEIAAREPLRSHIRGLIGLGSSSEYLHFILTRTATRENNISLTTAEKKAWKSKRTNHGHYQALYSFL